MFEEVDYLTPETKPEGICWINIFLLKSFLWVLPFTISLCTRDLTEQDKILLN